MNIWIHSTIAATSLIATIAVAFAGVAAYDASAPAAAAKGDRLAIAKQAPANVRHFTVETRGEQLSVLCRMPVTLTSSIQVF